MSRSLFFTGIDGSGKTSCADSLIAKLKNNHVIVKFDGREPYLFADGGKKQLIRENWYEPIQQVRSRLERHNFTWLFMVFQFLHKFIITKYVATFVRSDFIIYDTDMLLHPAAYSILHFPWIKRFSEKSRFNVLYALFRPRKNGVIFYLDTDPIVAAERILKRSPFKDPHENVSDLEQLKTQFDRIIVAAANSGLDIVKIDTNGRSVESVVTEVETVLRQKFPLVM